MLRARYLSSEPLFRTRDLKVRGVGIREAMPAGLVDRPEGTGDFLFMLFHDPVLLGLPKGSRMFPAGTIMFWSCGAGHCYGNPGQPWTHSWIHCGGPGVSAGLRRARLRPNSPFTLVDPSRVERQLLALYEELSGRLRRDDVIVTNIFSILLRETARSRDPLPAPPTTSALARAREILDTRYDKPLSLAALAREVGLSQSHLCEEFRRTFGFPPMSYLTERRMRVAALLLADTSKSVGEIGRQVGYPDPFHFSRSFKSVHGVPPSHLRKS
jgi:AraC family transcriptional regulator of arabinose operon